VGWERAVPANAAACVAGAQEIRSGCAWEEGIARISWQSESVAQALPTQGLGLKFQALANKDISKLSLLLERARAAFLMDAAVDRLGA
jgi:hypothetical protein